MRALVQRVSEANVEVDGSIVGSITHGLCVFVGVTHTDTKETVGKLANKLLNLRIFEDDLGKTGWFAPLVSGP